MISHSHRECMHGIERRVRGIARLPCFALSPAGPLGSGDQPLTRLQASLPSLYLPYPSDQHLTSLSSVCRSSHHPPSSTHTLAPSQPVTTAARSPCPSNPGQNPKRASSIPHRPIPSKQPSRNPIPSGSEVCLPWPAVCLLCHCAGCDAHRVSSFPLDCAAPQVSLLLSLRPSHTRLISPKSACRPRGTKAC